MGNSLDDDTSTVKEEIVKRVRLSKIPLLDGKQFDIPWEAQATDDLSTPSFVALTPAPYGADVEHALLVLSEPSNDSIQFLATHNYQWISQTQFNPYGQLQKQPMPNKPTSTIDVS